MTDYKIKGRHGITDLKSTYPYHGDWGYFSAYYNLTEEEYLKDVEGYIKRVQKDNEDYISQLHKEGKFGEEFEITLTMQDNPVFDNSNFKNNLPSLKSYKFLILGSDGK